MSKPLSVEELLKPRIKVLEEDTSGRFVKGEVLTPEFVGNNLERYYLDPTNDWDYIDRADIDRFPHLFAPIPWWAEREESQMPEYVSFGHRGKVLRVNKWLILELGEVKLQFRENGSFRFAWEYNNFKPATLAEYEQYESTLTPKQ